MTQSGGASHRPDELVYFRYPRESDRMMWLQIRQASRHVHEPWEPAPVPGFDPWGESAFELALNSCNLPDRQRFLVFDRTSHELVAQIGLSQIFRGPFNNAVMGYWGSSLHAGRGYVSAGVRLVLSHAFAPPTFSGGLWGLGLHRVEANVIPENHASIRVVRAAGMRLEGFSPRYLQIAGSYRDHLRFAMTSDNWAGDLHAPLENG